MAALEHREAVAFVAGNRGTLDRVQPSDRDLATGIDQFFNIGESSQFDT